MLVIVSMSVFLVPIGPKMFLEANFGLILLASPALMCLFGLMGTHRVCVGVFMLTSLPSCSFAFDCISRSNVSPVVSMMFSFADVTLDVGELGLAVGSFVVCSTGWDR